MEAMLKINLIPHQIYILLHISIQHLSIWSQCLIHNKHQTRIAFTSPFKSTDERNGRRIRIGPESRRSRSDRNQNPLKIRIQILLYSGTNLMLLFARVLDTHPVLAHILMWVCGSAAWTRSGQGGARGSGGRVLAEDDTRSTYCCTYLWSDVHYVCMLQQVCFICINADHYHVTANERIAPAGGVSMETEMLDWHPCSEWRITYCILKNCLRDRNATWPH